MSTTEFTPLRSRPRTTMHYPDEETVIMKDLNTAALDPSERTRCEVWTRVMGYHRPVSAFNTGKRAEHAERCYFTEHPRGTVLRESRVEPRRAAA